MTSDLGESGAVTMKNNASGISKVGAAKAKCHVPGLPNTLSRLMTMPMVSFLSFMP